MVLPNHARSGRGRHRSPFRRSARFRHLVKPDCQARGRKIAGIASIDLKKLEQPIRITLLPECEVVGEVVCPELSPEAFGAITVSIGQPDTAKALIQWRQRNEIPHFAAAGNYMGSSSKAIIPTRASSGWS